MKNKYGIVPLIINCESTDVDVAFGEWCEQIIKNYNDNKLSYLEINVTDRNVTFKGFPSIAYSSETYFISLNSLASGFGYSIVIEMFLTDKKYSIEFLEI